MGAQPVQDWQNSIASALEWWRDAGVDTLVDDDPRDWLAVVAPRIGSETAPAAVAAPAPEVLPDTLEAFVAWRLSDAAPETAWMAPRVGPSGPIDAEWVVITDIPESEDSDRLMTGPEGRLLDRMLAALGLSRESVYLAAIATARPVAARIPPDEAARLGELLRHHLSLLAPRKLLLLGQSAAGVLSETAGSGAANRIHDIKEFGGNTATVATYHPRFMLERPAIKAEVWKHLQLLHRGPST
ncbi:uracil-DNA glycosylase family protein [Sphingomonas hengshuiensis]|uniref:Uracil-DNA glycosylase-like domain-containing protein n=1 Tax=Sphingomonas hengshuiensis TaxID=1609977 RepID=A0A7U4LEI6_9SPHN|nr:uracil-DNA glycosylase family protein [Sphingomonas hengshuiensis]AJP71435.1 hypothetical protein TS85_06095 [Sphingomonas hengshuiensis]